MAYDPLGRLWQVSGPSGTTRFLYDGDRLVMELNGSSAVTRSYVHGPGTDEPLVLYDGTLGWARRFLHADHQGSIVALNDDSGNVVAIDAYDPWGIPKAGHAGRFGYTGQTWIPELGLWYYKARFYSPTLGRFLQTDPVGYEDQINLYAYVGNDPLNSTDPTGTVCFGTCPMIPDKVAIATDGATYLNINVNSETGEFWKGAITLGSLLTPAGEAKGVATAAEQLSPAAKGLATAAAKVEAGVARSQGMPRSAAATGLATASGRTFTGRSTTARIGAEANHPRVQRALDSVPPRAQSDYHGCCGEIQALNRAIEAGEDLRGAVVATVRIGTEKLIDECSSCQHVLRVFGVGW